MYSKLFKEIEKLARSEQSMANNEYGPFPTWEHGLAVIQSEITETLDEAKQVDLLSRHLWSQYHGKDFQPDDFKVLKRRSIMLACESIQVAAMAQKMLDCLAPDDKPEFAKSAYTKLMKEFIAWRDK